MTGQAWVTLARAVLWLGLLGLARWYLDALPMPEPDPGGSSHLALAGARLLATGLWWYLVALTAIGAMVHTVALVRRRTRPWDVPLPGAATVLRVMTGLGVGLAGWASAAAGNAQASSPPTLQREPPPATPSSSPDPDPLPSAVDHLYVVQAGESFWSISSNRLFTALGRAPSEAEIAPAWLALIDVNAHRLVEPGNPDLLHPGQALLLPPTPR